MIISFLLRMYESFACLLTGLLAGSKAFDRSSLKSTKCSKHAEAAASRKTTCEYVPASKWIIDINRNNWLNLSGSKTKANEAGRGEEEN